MLDSLFSALSIVPERLKEVPDLGFPGDPAVPDRRFAPIV
jgi:hypothetical protein